MLKQEDNEKITQSGPGTPLGNLLRSYWQPAALVSEMTDERPVKQVRIMGEDLVLFKKPKGWGLISRYCAHRGVDLSYGRLEEDGIRCLYHGWLYDSDGRCIDQPAEPDHSKFLGKVRIANYPCVERNGIIFTYMGAGETPPFPHFDAYIAPEEYTFAFKGMWECNWLQGLEGGIDPSHVSFLHKFIQEDPREMYGQQFAEEVAGTGKKLSMLVGENDRPDIEVESAEHGLRVFAVRQLTEDIKHVRVTNLMFPNAFVVPFGNDKVFTQWHVPIDDENHHWFMILYDFSEHTDKETLLQQRLQGVTLPDYRPVRNRSNNWGFDPQEQKDLTYTGMGLDINVHDQWAVESMGRVQDRTVERLGVSDRAITANRRMLLRAMNALAAGAETPALPKSEEEAAALIGPRAVDTIAVNEAWQERWEQREQERRDASPWAGGRKQTGASIDA